MTTVLAIDPGTNILGWSILKADGDEVTLIDYGAKQFNQELTLLDKLNSIYLHFFKLLSDHKIDVLMIEKTFRVDRGSIALVVSIKIIQEIAELVDDLKIMKENAMRVRKYFGVGARSSDVAKQKVKEYIISEYGVEDGHPFDVYDSILLGTYAIDKLAE